MDRAHTSDTSPAPFPRAKGRSFDQAEDFAAVLPAKACLLGIDPGTRTLGLALSDITRMIASPLAAIRRTRLNEDLKQILAAAAQYGAAGFVVGLPRALDGREGPQAQSARAFGRNLNAHSALPVLFWDERLSTVAAERTLLAADASRKRRSEVIDKMAAAIILQGALDRMRRPAAMAPP